MYRIEVKSSEGQWLLLQDVSENHFDTEEEAQAVIDSMEERGQLDCPARVVEEPCA
jgi:hypothetical protein